MLIHLNYVKCEDHESDKKRKIAIFEMNGNTKGVQWHHSNHRLVIKLNPKNCVAKLLGKVH